MEEKIIAREKYVEKIKPFIGKNVIKILTGQRRVGKSYILLQLIEEIKTSVVGANIISINLELEAFRFLKTSKDLYEYVNGRLVENAALNYLFVDEIQEIADFQNAVRSLLAEQKCDILITGSNANLLSGELATLLSGRYVNFEIHALSYKEFQVFHDLENSQQTLEKYLTFGGLPFLRNLELSENQSFEYLKNVYSTILLKDVVAREKIRNVAFLENLVAYLADNVGNLFSASNISKYLKNQKVDVSTQVVINYLRTLANSFFIHKVVRSDVAGLKIFEIGEKYYFEDLGLRNVISGFNAVNDIEKLLENAVYLHLIQCDYKVFVGKTGDKEIDFVGEKDGIKIYVQVSLTIMDTKTREREFSSLLPVQDNYAKYIVTLNDMHIGNNYKGVQCVNLKEFLEMEL
ncbi:MAG: ATP-binding protein [Tannerella sp.]|jgi:predicted AAA+ superfamily ATPase|nr:ATP-binding protein [Tannerella sp.]